jgi:formate dehydrogenase major subunit
VQGATDLGLDVTTLPLYYGLAEDAWRHWCRVWEVDYEWMRSRFPSKTLMETPGIPSTRWFDATLLPKDQVSQPDNVQAMFVMGHGVNTITRMPEAVRAMEKLELLVVCDPYPTAWSVLSERKNRSYLLPACTSFEMYGSRTASNRSLQWGEKIVEPVFESKNDYDTMYLFAENSASPTGCSRTSRSRTTQYWRRISCAKSIAAGGRRATADNLPSGSRLI